MNNLENAEKFSEKLLAFGAAAELVQPIVEQHGLETMGVGGNLMAPATKLSAVDQHVDQIIRLADWLLEK